MNMCKYVNCVLIEKWLELNRSMIICEYLKYILYWIVYWLESGKVNLNWIELNGMELWLIEMCIGWILKYEELWLNWKRIWNRKMIWIPY